MTILNNCSRLKSTRKELRNEGTRAERELWKYLQGSKLEGYKFRRQHSIGRYILDFYCPKLKLAIELDGKIHENREEYDVIRTEYLNAVGIRVLRFTNDQVFQDIDQLLENLKIYIN